MKIICLKKKGKKMNDDNRYPITKYILVSVLAFVVAWFFFFVRGFAYDLEIDNYDFNGFDSNADSIFEDFIQNDADFYTYSDSHNLNLLLQKLKENGYTQEYIDQFRIKVQTTQNDVSSVPREQSESEMLTTENGATDAIVSDENMTGISDDLQNDLFSDSETENENITTNEDITTLLSDIISNQEEMSTQLSTLNRLTEENQAYYLKFRGEDTKSVFDKQIENFTVTETIGLILVAVCLIGGVVFLCYHFVPTFGRR